MMPSGGASPKDVSGLLSWPISTDSLPQTLCLTLSYGEKPLEPNPTRLSEVLEENADERYNLSAQACAGILRRAEKRGKQLPEQLEAALKHTLSKSEGGVERDSNGRQAGKGPLIQTELSATLGVSQDQTLIKPGGCQQAFEQHSQDSRYNPLGDVCETVNAKYGTGGNNTPIVIGGGATCIGNGQADIASHITVEMSQTLNAMHDPMAIVYEQTL